MKTFEEYLNERVYKGLKADLTKGKPHWDDLSKEERSNYINFFGNIKIPKALLDENGKLEIIFPDKWNKDFYCSNIPIKSLEGCPEEVMGDFNCSNTEITSLDGCPRKVGGSFYCYGGTTKFTEEAVRKISNVEGVIYVV